MQKLHTDLSSIEALALLALAGLWDAATLARPVLVPAQALLLALNELEARRGRQPSPDASRLHHRCQAPNSPNPPQQP